MSEELRRLSDEALSEVLRGLPRTPSILLWLSKYSDATRYEPGTLLSETHPIEFVFGDIVVFVGGPLSPSKPTINGEEVDFFDIDDHLQHLLRTRFIEEGRVITW